MRTLSIDIETYSSIDLVKVGAYRYAFSPDFEILLFAYAFDDEEISIIDIASGENIPEEIITAILDKNIIKTAFNANFERQMLSKHLNKPLYATSWQCTAVQSALLGLPLSLEGVGKVLGLDNQKMKEGKDLIRYFCKPCKPTKLNGGRTRNRPSDNPEKWDLFKKYCIRDVDVERNIRNKLAKFPIPDKELEFYKLDQKINDTGVMVDIDFVNKAIECDELLKYENYAKAQKLTGLKNPNSVAQLKKWLLDNGVEVESLSRKSVTDMVKEADGEVEMLLNLRLQLAKTSIKKYEAIKRSVCPDGRVRGMFQFYGANRTGRFAGRIIQLHNLPQNHENDLDLARNILKLGSYEDLEMFFEDVPTLLSELIRTAFIPKKHSRFIVADFSAIEARVIAWMANEKWRNEVFATHGKIYEASASKMFKVPIEEITKGSDLRQKGKIAELALGYGGSVGALTSMGALEMGLKEEELKLLVNAWRNSNPNIVNFWWDVDRALLKAVKEKVPQKLQNIEFIYKSGMLFIKLPSGRKLSYVKPRIEINKFGRDSITYEGIGSTKRWERVDTYGAKLVENIVQGVARDILVEAMTLVNKKGHKIVMHCHDEVVIEAPNGFGSVDDVCSTMAITPKWAKGLILRAEGFEANYYRKG